MTEKPYQEFMELQDSGRHLEAYNFIKKHPELLVDISLEDIEESPEYRGRLITLYGDLFYSNRKEEAEEFFGLVRILLKGDEIQRQILASRNLSYAAAS